MTDITPSASSVVYGVFDGSRPSPAFSPTNAAASAALSLPLPSPLLLPSRTSDPASERQSGSVPTQRKSLRGTTLINAETLRDLREARYLSQQELADDCNHKVSIATIKRAETGHRVRFRICRELARYFGVSIDDLLR